MFYIYKIQNCNYIGSTTDLIKREKKHNTNKDCKYSSAYNCKLYKYVRKNNIKIKLIPVFEYNNNCSKKIKLLVEQYYIDKYDSINNGLNTNRAFVNKIPYIKGYDKRRYEKNKEFVNRKINCPICNFFGSKRNLKQHQRSKKCKNSI